MEGNEFVVEIPQKLNVEEIETEELDADYLSYFSKEECRIYELKRSGVEPMGTNAGKLQKAINKWWFDKYAFPYAQTANRRALLSRKYAKSEDNSSAKLLQDRLFSAVRLGNIEEYQQVYHEYLEQFPDQLEGVTALLEFSEHLDRHNFLSEHSFKDDNEAVRKEMLKQVEESTQYAFLLTHFLVANGDDKEFLRSFWDVIEQMGKSKDMLNSTHKLRRGILSQVAVLHVFEKLGMNPKLSHPHEDAFKSVDLWVDGEGAVQVKGTDKTKNEMFIETDEIDFPGVQTTADGGEMHVNSHLFKEFNKFKARLSKYQDELQKPLRGYFAVMPYHEFDHVTGIPSEEIVKRSAESLGVSYELEPKTREVS